MAGAALGISNVDGGMVLFKSIFFTVMFSENDTEIQRRWRMEAGIPDRFSGSPENVVETSTSWPCSLPLRLADLLVVESSIRNTVSTLSFEMRLQFIDAGVFAEQFNFAAPRRVVIEFAGNVKLAFSLVVLVFRHGAGSGSEPVMGLTCHPPLSV